jgi:16S rRNA (cytosine967-C5)-methyltransferase
MPTNPRIAAHRILKDVRGGAFADQSAARILPTVAAPDRGLALELAYGCLRLRGRLDTELRALTDRPLKRIEPEVLDWLRLGLFQLRELRVPDHAAVSETVRHASRMMDPARVGFINAVLRAATKTDEREDPFPSRDLDPVGYLSTYGSHPEWLVRRWLERWGWHDAFRLVKQNNAPPPVFARLLEEPGEEPAMPSEADVANEAEKPVEGGELELGPLKDWPRSRQLVRGSPMQLLNEVDAVIQDPAASAVVEFVGRELEGPVYDACSAPGTKAMVIAREARRARPYVAADVSPGRLGLAVESSDRLNVPIDCVVADGRHPAIGHARTVILDAPCTGTGVLRRRPDARWRIDDDRLASLVELQSELLEGCAEIVDPGGLLVYATCSLEPEENEEQMEGFLERHEDFERERSIGNELPETALTDAGDLFVRPWISGTDGAYACRLRRAAG